METMNEEQGTEKSITDEIESVLTDIATDAPAEKEKKQRITLIEEDIVMIDQRKYRLVENYREAFDIEKMNERYSDVLNRYDYIVGDIGFEQLRLKGFFSETQKRMPVEQRIGSLQDYLYEYCNFGCAYFVLEREGAGTRKEKPQNRNKRNNRKNTQKPTQPAHIQEKQGKASEKPTPRNKKAPVIKNRQDKERSQAKKKAETKPIPKKATDKKRGFTIRQKDE
ncbi:YutD family protein [Vagococcus allomyrinae]|nr:YutD family protein [Vagococcus allomyrinae]